MVIEWSTDLIIEIVFGVSALLAFLITFIRTGSISKSIKNLKEVQDLKYQTQEDRVQPSQSFSETVPDYVLNPSSNELERLPVDKNIQEYIQSFVDTALANALERFLPKVISEDDDTVESYADKQADLGSLADAMDIAEEYREKYNLPDSYSMADIYSFVDQQASAIKSKLADLNKPKGGVEDGPSSQKTSE